MTAIAGFSCGDKIPQFLLPDQAGVKRSFYHELIGKPIFLAICAAAHREGLERGLSKVAAQAGNCEARGAQVMALSNAPVFEVAEVAKKLGITFPVFADPENRIAGQLLKAPDGAPADTGEGYHFVAFLLDANQRVLESARGGADGESLLQRLERLSPPPPNGPVLQVGAPVLILPEIFERDLCEALIGAWTADHHEGVFSTGKEDLKQAGGDKGTYDPNQKKTLEHSLVDQDLRSRVALSLARRIAPELVKAYNYQKPFKFEAFTVMRYVPDRGDFFGIHRDDVRQNNKRRFAASVNLNGGFEGGELQFPEYGRELYRAPAGAAAVFSTQLLHQALPVTMGERFVLTAFFCDPDDAAPGIPDTRRKALQL